MAEKTREATRVPEILCDGGDDGPETWAWVPVGLADSMEAAVALFAEVVPMDDEFLDYAPAEGPPREWLRESQDPERWNKCEPTDPGAYEFWRIEVVDREAVR